MLINRAWTIAAATAFISTSSLGDVGPGERDDERALTRPYQACDPG